MDSRIFWTIVYVVVPWLVCVLLGVNGVALVIGLPLIWLVAVAVIWWPRRHTPTR